MSRPRESYFAVIYYEIVVFSSISSICRRSNGSELIVKYYRCSELLEDVVIQVFSVVTLVLGPLLQCLGDSW